MFYLVRHNVGFDPQRINEHTSVATIANLVPDLLFP